MTSEGASFQVGNVGQGATVLQGEYLTNVTVQVQNVDDARAVLSLLNKELGKRSYHGPLLRRLDPIVLANRASELGSIRKFFEESDASVLFVVGLAGIGKSTLVRGALEYRGSSTVAIWINCEGLDVERLLTDIDASLGLGLQAMLHDPKLDLAQKLAALLSAVQIPAILILDNFEDLLGKDEKYNNKALADFVEALTAYEHRTKTIVTTRRLPSGVGAGSAAVDILRLGGLSETRAMELFRNRTDLPAIETNALFTPGVLAKLEGHPKFIELLASSISELPLQQVIQGLLTATDIGDYIVGQVLDQLDEIELNVLRAALVFRGAFSFDALASVYRSMHPGDTSIAPAVRSLARHAV
ncbi:MAG TPA: AAA family ATPase, partial [Anaerolineales bacterium]|nr:AAA family ATPase [Anaerolineales bacterium]